ncbi:MAG TPA: cytochrome c-type biogenesis protein CcmH [Gemmatimonadaceae bacterium]|nr:cytochrome c-type biogenesis protein CcmH [Gemmatimonadaceae bacterium]
MKRREFLRVVAAGAASAALPGVLGAQQVNTGAANVPMNEQKYKPVRLPAKSSTPSMSTEALDELEHHIHCMCGCNLDVFTCRTTDFTCPVSPAMHRDVMALVNGGHSAQEIIDAFVGVYGERVLMEPKKEGFNLTGYITPFAALGGGAALIVALLRRWKRPEAAPASVTTLPVEGTPEEMARLDELLHKDDR